MASAGIAVGPFGVRNVLLAPAEQAVAIANDPDLARRRAEKLGTAEQGALSVAVPGPSAAFSRRDLLLPGYSAAAAVVRAHGFDPVVRPVGGRLAVYDEGSLVLHLMAGHPEPRVHVRRRFELFGEAVSLALRRLGVDARVGPVPGEYCEGEFSVNDGGRAKLVGTGQRLTRTSYLFSAVIMVQGADRARHALTAAYSTMGLEFRPETVGCVADSVPGVMVDDVRTEVLIALGEMLTVEQRVTSQVS